MTSFESEDVVPVDLGLPEGGANLRTTIVAFTEPADYHLLASATELYEALEVLLDACEQVLAHAEECSLHGLSPGTQTRLTAAVARAYVALAKARGLQEGAR